MRLALDDESMTALVDTLVDRVCERLSVHNIIDMDPYLGVDNVAFYVDCPKSRIYALTSSGQLVPDVYDGQSPKWRKSNH
jgi:hypothetical protein